VWGRYLFFHSNSQVRVFENKKISKNRPGLILLFLGDLKNHSGLGLRNPEKKGDYEVGAEVRVLIG
jgi:hypothetical protein